MRTFCQRFYPLRCVYICSLNYIKKKCIMTLFNRNEFKNVRLFTCLARCTTTVTVTDFRFGGHRTGKKRTELTCQSGRRIAKQLKTCSQIEPEKCHCADIVRRIPNTSTSA